MKKLYSLLFALLLAVGVLAGCGGGEDKTKDNSTAGEKQEAQQEVAAFPVTIKDALDNDVVIDAKPEKIVSLIPSNTEIVFSLGMGKTVVGVNDYDNYPAEVQNIEKIGGMEFNVEKIISLKPNLVLAHKMGAESGKEGIQQLRDAGLTVFVVNDAASFEEAYDSIAMIGTAIGEKEAAEKIIAGMKDKVEEFKTKAKEIKAEDKKSVFIEISPAPEIYAAGSNTFMNEMLSFINAENTVADEGWPKLDPEAVIEKNPDVIITTHGDSTENPVEDVLNREGWQDITAVKNKQVFNVDTDKVSRSGPRLVEGVEELAKAIYPEIFK